jgi:CRISPR type IV-associated protein Csf3
MQNLKISCKVNDIVSTDGLFPLDSILAAEWMRQNYPEEYYNDGAKENLIEPELPLAQIEIAGHKVWAASVAQYKLHGEYVHYWHKRLDQYLTGRNIDKPKRINVSSAEYKNYRMPINIMLINNLTWFCVGEPGKIKDLLWGIKSLGKKRSQGFGMVELDHMGKPAWNVEEWPEDWSVYGPGGKLMRIIPFDDEIKKDMVIRRWGIKPPYWLNENQVIAVIPEVGNWYG